MGRPEGLPARPLGAFCAKAWAGLLMRGPDAFAAHGAAASDDWSWLEPTSNQLRERFVQL